jgi:hypothetical protein
MRVDELVKPAGAASGGNGSMAGALRRALTDSARRASPPLRPGQSAAPARSGGADPLAELARLIEQDEAFGAIVRGSRPEQGGELSVQHEDAGAPLVPSFLCDEPTGEPRARHDDGAHDNPDYAHGLPDQRRGLRVFVGLFGLALAGCASALAYWAWFDGRARTSEAPVIGASLAPDKTLSSPQGENSRSDERLRSRSDEPSVNGSGPTIAGDEKSADAKPAVPPAALLYGPAPAKVAALTPAAPPTIPAATAQDQPPDVKEPAPGGTAPGTTEPSPAQGGYVVQLSSQRSEAAAQATSRVLQTKYAGAFSGRQPFIRRSDLGDRGVYYRVLTGPFPIGEAKQFCGDLKKSGADCVVQRN